MPVERYKSFEDINDNDPKSYEGLICTCEEGYLYMNGEMEPGEGEVFACEYCGGKTTRLRIRNAARWDRQRNEKIEQGNAHTHYHHQPVGMFGISKRQAVISGLVLVGMVATMGYFVGKTIEAIIKVIAG